MKKIYQLFFCQIFLVCSLTYAQPSAGSRKSHIKWKVDPFNHPAFIENKGQFLKDEQKNAGSTILYSSRKGNITVYFTSNSVVYRIDNVSKGKDDDNDADGGKENLKLNHHFLKMTWEGANPNPVMEVQEQTSNYFTYGNPNDKTGKSGIKAKGWKKLIYHNVYNGIDVEFFYPAKGGIEYTVIVKPGADISQFKMHYSSAVQMQKKNILITAPYMELTDHAPIAFIDTNGNEQAVPVSFKLSGNTVSFEAGSFDKRKTLTIDPWISSPGFAGANHAYDLDIDLRGNIYVYGSAYPYLLDKYNSSGVLQWTYTSTFSYQFNPGFSFYGGMCVDGHSGSSFMSEGFDASAGGLIKVNTNGVQVATNIGSSNYQEIWRMRYDNCEQKGVMLGGGTTGNSYQIAMLDTTLATFNPTQILVISHMDFSMLALDNTGNAYALDDQDDLIKAAMPTFSPDLFNVPSGYFFGELTQPPYITSIGYPGPGGNGFNGLVTSPNYLYSYDGATLKKWNLSTGANLANTTVYSTPFLAGGLTVTNCDNIFLGILDSAYQYDVNLHKVTEYLLPDTVYDMKLGGSDNTLYACGNGFICAVDVSLNPVSISSSSPSSCSACDGRGTVNITCGIAPYTYLWSDGKTSQTDSSLCAGIHSVRVMDASCPPIDDSLTVIISGKNGYSATVKDTNPGCIAHEGNITVYPYGGSSPYIYSWSNGETNQEDTGLAAGTYSCTITDHTGCATFIIATLINPAPPVIKVSPASTTICKGSNVAFSTSGGSVYYWLPAAGLSCDSCPNPTASPTATTTYTVMGIDTNGCSGTVTASIVVNPTPKPIITGQDSVCVGAFDTLQATGGSSYLWSTGATTTSIYYHTLGTQTITVTAYNGLCSHDTSFVIHAVSPAGSIVASRDSACAGDSILLSGSGGLKYKWSTGATTSTIWVSPAVPETYTLYAYIGECKDSVIKKLNITPLVTATIHAINDTVCPGQPSTITATGAGGPVTYAWNTGAVSSSITVNDTVSTTYTVTVSGPCNTVQKIMRVVVIPLPVASISGTNWKCKGQTDTLTVTGSASAYKWNNGKTTDTIVTDSINADSVFYLTAYNSLGCSITISDTVHLRQAPAVNASSTVFCAGQPLNLTASATGTNPPFNYSWSTGQTGSSITIDPGPDSTTTYTVSASNGCKGNQAITVIPNTPLIVACCSQTIVNLNDTTTLWVSGNSHKYIWEENPTSGSITCLDSLCDTVRVITSVTTTYTVIGTDSNGCQGEELLIINVDEPCFKLIIPNVITPTNPGPEELNGEFYIETKNMDAWSLTIYDRWGKMMFSTTNPSEYWTGTTEGGSQAPDGVYYYIINATCESTTYKQAGFVQLIR